MLHSLTRLLKTVLFMPMLFILGTAGGAGGGAGDGGASGGQGGQGGASGDGGQKKKIEVSPEVQAHFDAVFNMRYSEIQTQTEAKYKGEIENLKTQISTLQAGKGKPPEGGDDLTALKTRLATLEANNKASQERERQANIRAIAAELNAVSADQVGVLISPYLKVEESGAVNVFNADGQIRFNGQGKAMTVKELVAEFLNQNPHLVKAGGQPGAGSQGAKGGGAVDHAALLKLPPTERLKEARRQGLK